MLGVVLLAGCSRSANTKGKARGKGDTPPDGADTASSDTLRVLAMEGFIGKEVLKAAMDQGMVKITLDTFTTEEEFDKKWKGGEGRYDVLFPPLGKLLQLKDEDAIAPLDRASMENLKNIDPKLLSSYYDKDNKYTVPVFFQPLLAMGIRKDLVQKPVKGLEILFDESVKGKIGITDEPDKILSAFLMYQGHEPSLDGNNPGKVKDLLMKLRPSIKLITSESLADKLRKGEIVVALDNYSNLAGINVEEEKNLQIFIPETGSPIWVESACVPTNAPNASLGFWFLDYLLGEEIALANAMETNNPTVSLPARAKLPAEDQKNSLVYPPAPPKAKDLGDWLYRMDTYDMEKLAPLWKEIKAAN